jgi:hypothetical protein
MNDKLCIELGRSLWFLIEREKGAPLLDGLDKLRAEIDFPLITISGDEAFKKKEFRILFGETELHKEISAPHDAPDKIIKLLKNILLSGDERIVKWKKSKKFTKKARFIKKLAALSAFQKCAAINFFTLHPNYENRIDWNRRDLSYGDFEKAFALKNPAALLSKQNCKIVCESPRYVIAIPLDWKCAVFMRSAKSGGGETRWCIGDKRTSSHWNFYASQGSVFYFVCLKTPNPLLGHKLILERLSPENGGGYRLWLSDNTCRKGLSHILHFSIRGRLADEQMEARSLLWEIMEEITSSII